MPGKLKYRFFINLALLFLALPLLTFMIIKHEIAKRKKTKQSPK
jgi:hypothetical protein